MAKAGLIATETRRDLLSNLLVIVVPSDSKLVVASPEELVTKSQKIAVADPRAVPAGIYTKEYLIRLGLWQKLEPKIVPTENVRAALAAVESGKQLQTLHREFGVPMLFVTHDPMEATAICEEVLLLQAGRIIGRGDPAKTSRLKLHIAVRALLRMTISPAKCSR